jgi:Tfp pilus assembly protein PilF
MSRLEAIKALVEQNPADSRIRFMLSMEYISGQRFPEALAELDALLAGNPDYVAAWFQAGRCCETSGESEKAREYYSKGIEAARRTGDQHALSELQAALDLL